MIAILTGKLKIKLNKYNLDILERIKTGNKAIYVLRPDFINSFKMLNAN